MVYFKVLGTGRVSILADPGRANHSPKWVLQLNLTLEITHNYTD